MSIDGNIISTWSKWSEVREKQDHPARWCQINVELREVVIKIGPDGKPFPGDYSEIGLSLSIHGHAGNSPCQGYEMFSCADGKRRAMGSSGQLREELAEFFPEYAKYLPYHMNDTRPGCAHHDEWDVEAEIEIAPYHWTDKYYEMRKKAEFGKLSYEEYEKYRIITYAVEEACFGLYTPKHPDRLTQAGRDVLADGWIEAERREKKMAGWVKPEEHPDGLLTKQCPTCGYCYGTAWLYRPLPQDVIEWAKKGGK